MPEQSFSIENKSGERKAFEHYLRTGRRLLQQGSPTERKFNPYHDPRNGQFTFAPGGPRSLTRVIVSDRRRLHRPDQAAMSGPDLTTPALLAPAVDDQPSGQRPGFQLAQFRPNPRSRIGGNGGPPLNDPMTLQRVFPGLATHPPDQYWRSPTMRST